MKHMIKYYIIVILVLTSMGIVVTGLIQKNVLWILFGCFLMLVSYFVLKKLREKYEIDYSKTYEKKYQAPNKIQLKHVILALIAILILIVLWRAFTLVFSGGSYLDIQSAINDGCNQLEPKKFCRKDPSTIIVNFDVNKDGVVGGQEDTLSALLETQGCVGDCIRVRCGCPQ